MFGNYVEYGTSSTKISNNLVWGYFCTVKGKMPTWLLDYHVPNYPGILGSNKTKIKILVLIPDGPVPPDCHLEQLCVRAAFRGPPVHV